MSAAPGVASSLAGHDEDRATFEAVKTLAAKLVGTAAAEKPETLVYLDALMVALAHSAIACAVKNTEFLMVKAIEDRLHSHLLQIIEARLSETEGDDA